MIKDVLRANNYPSSFFEPIIKKRIHQLYNTNHNKPKQNEPNNYISLPYVRGTSENIQKILEKHQLKVAHKPNNCSSKCFSKMCPKYDAGEHAGVVYKIQCKQCNGAYIGQTQQYLHKRLCNHKNNVRNNKPDTSALAKHAIENGHCFDFQNTKILTNENDFQKRLVLEMLHIAKEDNTINNRSDIQNLSRIYHNLIKNT